MKKTIKVLSVISLVCSCMALVLALAFTSFLWRPLGSSFASSQEVINAGPRIPIGNMISIFGYLVVSLLLLITAKVRRVIAIEIIAIVLLCVVLPPAIYLSGMYQNIFVGRAYGSLALASLASTSSMFAVPTAFSGISFQLSLITSGMRIADKVHNRK